MEDNVAKIKDRLDVVEVLSGYIKLQKAGINFKGRCPFHNEKTPSFFVSPDRQIWHCFGCAKGGDMFEFIKEVEGVEFPEAVRILAARAGIELQAYRGGATREVTDAKTRLFEICQLSTKFFQKQFQSNIGKKALQYLTDRGVTAETITEFKLGFAPNDWHALSEYLARCGYSNKEIVDSGMAILKERGGIYDRFRSRIIFPITDITGQVVGFTGRVFDPPIGEPGSQDIHQNSAQVTGLDQSVQSVAKYVNSPQTLIYDKSRILYGLSQAKLDIKRGNQCILVEGNMDALMSYQAGVRNVVATSGTALTPHHLRLLQRYTTNLGFCFDSDEAGKTATKRGIGLALSQNFNINVLEIRDTECKDPADYVKKYGSKWSDVVASARPVLEYYFETAKRGFDPTSVESKKTVLLAVAPFIKRLTSQVERAHWVSQLALLFRTNEGVVEKDIVSAKDEFEAYVREVSEPDQILAAPAPVEPPDMLNEAILSLVLKNPELLRNPSTEIPYELLNKQTSAILQKMQAMEKPDFASLIGELDKSIVMHLEFAHLRAQELWQEFSPDQLDQEFKQLLVMLRRRHLSKELTNLEFEIKRAEASKDSAALQKLAQQFNIIAVQLSSLTYEKKETQQ
ncbi:toprim domain-containing protein [Candidatus Parcubacteria bacterium]|nr:toprim domain-containing protein [Candidatus Parcubacteria bacterium]